MLIIIFSLVWDLKCLFKGIKVFMECHLYIFFSFVSLEDFVLISRTNVYNPDFKSF